MNIRTETSHHDTNADDEEEFGKRFEAIYGKSWYDKRLDEEKTKEKNNV